LVEIAHWFRVFGDERRCLVRMTHKCSGRPETRDAGRRAEISANGLVVIFARGVGKSVSHRQKCPYYPAPMAKATVKWPASAKQTPPPSMNLADAYEIGRTVYQHFEEQPLRAIIEAESLSISKLTLHRCLAAYRVLLNLGHTPADCPFSFAIAVRLDLVNPEQQKALAKRVVADKLSTSQLEFEISNMRQTEPPKPGRQPMLRFARALGRLEAFVDGRYHLAGDLGRVAEVDASKRAAMLKLASTVRAQLQQVEKALAAAKPSKAQAKGKRSTKR